MSSLFINTNYKLLGFHEVVTHDSSGDIVTVDYYRDYDTVNEVYVDLAVKESFTYTRDSSGLVTRSDKTIEWFWGGVKKYEKVSFEILDAQRAYIHNQKSRESLVNTASMWILGELSTNEVYAVTAVDTVTNKFTIDEDITDRLEVGMDFYCSGSTGNDARYTVQSISLVSSDTEIVVEEDITDPTVDGNLVIGEALAKQFLQDVGVERGLYITGSLSPLLNAIASSTRVYMTTGRKSTLNSILNVIYS